MRRRKLPRGDLKKEAGHCKKEIPTQRIINKSEAVKKAKKEGGEKTPKEKKEISDEEKEYKSMRKKIQEKLIKLATRVPVFIQSISRKRRSR